jgi:formyl-CoA transferase
MRAKETAIPIQLGEVRGSPMPSLGKPLAGVRILAVEQMQALPFATRLLAQLGADVVKIEHPETGESGRGGRPRLRDEDGREVGATYLRNNLHKRSLALDLKHPDGRALFERLVPRFDVVAENLTPGAMDRLGLGFAHLTKRHPPLVYVSLSGFGHLFDSPYRSWPAYAPMVEAMSGMYEPTRKPDQPPAVVVAGALGDNASALFAVIGLLAALRARDRTGRGDWVDISMFDSMLAMSDMIPHLWSMDAPARWAAGGSLGVVAGFKADDGYFVISVLRPHHFERLAQVVGHPEWPSDARFQGLEAWAQQIEPEIRPAVEAWARGRTRMQACRLLCEQGIAAGPSNLAPDIAADPHVEARGMLIEVPRPDSAKPMLIVGNPVKLAAVPEGPVRRFPKLGEHTDEILRSELGLSAEDLTSLRERGAIGPR